jgi:ABC-type transport system involved in cytochrome c biogenesis permease component
MTARKQSVSLPLLGKELLELAAQPRTYVVRVVYAVLLYAAFGYFFGSFSEKSETLELLGAGRQMLSGLVRLQFVGTLLFLPPLMAGAIATEKERGTLELLFLTDLGAWELVIQKYISRLVPMFSFLLLGLPLMGIVYAFGGVDMGDVLAEMLMSILICLQVGALALACSAHAQTASEALLKCYFVAGPAYAALMWLFWMGLEPPPAWPIMVVNLLFTFGTLALAKRYLLSRAFVERSSIAGRKKRKLGTF